MLKFFSFRFNLLISNQPTLFFNKTKEEYFSDIMVLLKKNKKDQFQNHGGKYFVYFANALTDTTHLIILAREEKFEKPTEGKVNVVQVKDTRTPYLYVIIDLQRQIILIQDKSSVLKVETARDKLEYYFTQRLMDNKISIVLEPISQIKDFWEEVADADGIEEFDITLNAPNLFRGRFEASKFVQEVYDQYNISEFTIQFKNRLGQLKLMKENIQDYITLASAGAGEFTLKVIKNGKKKFIKSSQWIVKKIYPVDDINDINIDQLVKDLDELDTLNEKSSKQG